MMDERTKVVEARGYKVVKGNEIIQKARYDLSPAELKVFAFVLSKVKPTDNKDTKYQFTVNDYCDVLGIERNNGGNLQVIKKSLKTLRDTSFFLMNENGEETTVGWLDKVWIRPKSGRIAVRLDEDLQKYVLGYLENYTQYELICTLPMKSAYSIRIYELLKSYCFQNKNEEKKMSFHKQREFDLEELKHKLMCDHYVRFVDFRRRVLDVAVREINLYTDLEVRWEPRKTGKRVSKIWFDIMQRDSWARLNAFQRGTKELDGQMSIFDFIKE